MKKIVLISMLFSLNAHADEAVCNKINVIKKNSQQQIERFTFTQFGFNSKPELAIIVHNVNLPAQIKQVTFNRGNHEKTCYFTPLAFVQGGHNNQYWGWHLLWAEAGGGLFYARMDGEAWVSSNPKSLSQFSPINPQFALDGQTITVTWQQVENGLTINRQAVSQDEGRSWN